MHWQPLTGIAVALLVNFVLTSIAYQVRSGYPFWQTMRAVVGVAPTQFALAGLMLPINALEAHYLARGNVPVLVVGSGVAPTAVVAPAGTWT